MSEWLSKHLSNFPECWLKRKLVTATVVVVIIIGFCWHFYKDNKNNQQYELFGCLFVCLCLYNSPYHVEIPLFILLSCYKEVFVFFTRFFMFSIILRTLFKIKCLSFFSLSHSLWDLYSLYLCKFFILWRGPYVIICECYVLL